MAFRPVPGERTTETIRTVAERIRAIREMRGLSAPAAAGLAGFETSQYCRIERGEANPRMTTLDQVARGLGVRTRELLIGEEHSHISRRSGPVQAAESEHHLAALNLSVGQRIRGVREALGLTQRELADRAGTLPERVSRIERGVNGGTRVSMLDQLAEGLGLDFEDLFLYPEDEQKKERA